MEAPKRIEEYEIADLGWYTDAFFPGFGYVPTRFDLAQHGMGDTLRDAIGDAINALAESGLYFAAKQDTTTSSAWYDFEAEILGEYTPEQLDEIYPELGDETNEPEGDRMVYRYFGIRVR